MSLNLRHSTLPTTQLHFVSKIWTKATFLYFLLKPPALSFPNSQTNDLTSHFRKIDCNQKGIPSSSHHHFLPASIPLYAAFPPLQWKKFLRSPLLLGSGSCFLSLSQVLCSFGDPPSLLHDLFSPLCWLVPISIETCLNIIHLKQQSKLKTSPDPHICLQLLPHFSASLHGLKSTA